MSELEKVTIGELRTVDLSGPPKLFILRVGVDVMQSPSKRSAVCEIIENQQFVEYGHRCLIVDETFDFTEASDATLNAMGLMRKLSPAGDSAPTVGRA